MKGRTRLLFESVRLEVVAVWREAGCPALTSQERQAAEAELGSKTECALLELLDMVVAELQARG